MRRRNTLLLGLAVAAGILGFASWYMMGCKGRWNGEPLEATKQAALATLQHSLRSDVSYLADTVGPRNPAHPASLHRAAEWIRARWTAQGYTVRDQTFLVNGTECTNLEIEIPGRTRPSEIVLLSAQYDTWTDSPGANNNGSGMAVLLQLSELLRSHQPDRTLRLVAFTTQEPPYDNTESMGSLRYARRSRERGEDIWVMMSMDAIGIYKHEPGSQKLPFPFSLFYPSRGDFLGFITDFGSRSLVVAATRGFRKGSAFPIEAGSVPRWVPGARWSDHNSFWRLGYRAIQITDTGAFRSASHTTPEDTIEKIDFGALARITLGMYGSLVELTSVEES
jgi:Zn-dependent M28 family amino/carboxypeptidase